MRLCWSYLTLAAIASVMASAASAGEPIYASLVQLLATPERFDGKLVQVVGYVHLEFEGNQICLHREDVRVHLSRNCLWLVPPELSADARSQASDRYNIVIGRFNARSKGHMGLFSGAIEEVSRLDPWGPPP
jgi:hypothetical protein